MSFLRRTPRAVALALILSAWAAPALAQVEGYKPHMENGVKLYNDRNYPAAIVEFRAAYEAKPGPNPLVNVALCEKALFRYPRAITALESALAKHGEAMSAADRKAAEDAIKDMRALLGKVRLSVTPPSAVVLVDGEELAGAERVVDLGPGPHRVEVRAEGYAAVERSLTVASGQALDVTLALLPLLGLVEVEALEPEAAISIDGVAVGKGAFHGSLPVGPHAVRIEIAGVPPYEQSIVAAVDKPVAVRPPPRKLGDPLPLRRGFYVLGTGSILFPLVHPPDFVDPQADFGAGYGVRVGYQVNNTAGFDLSYQHSSIQTYQVGDAYGTRSYRLVSERVATGLRMSTPGSMWRFVGTIAGGLVYDQVLWGSDVWAACPQKKQDLGTCTLGSKEPGKAPAVHGFDAFGVVEAMAELDVDRVLIDVGMEFQFQATGGVAAPSDDPLKTYNGSVWGARPIIHIGPAIRIGYRFW